MQKLKTISRRIAQREIHALYDSPIRSTRGGALFNAFPYPTKISPETIALFIASHTEPGATVFDGFAGSGTTGLAAILCDCPTDNMKREAKKRGLHIRWGPRKAVLYELGVLGSFVSKVLCLPPDPKEFREAAQHLLAKAIQQYGWLYHTTDPSGATGTIRYTVWSDVLRCPSCRKHSSMWNACVSRNPAKISSTFCCPHCGSSASLRDVHRVHESSPDDVLDIKRKTRRRLPAWVYGETNGKTWAREADRSDLKLLQKIALEPVPECVPRVRVPWGDLYRSGYHKGITHLHHLYTRRNMIAFASLWSDVDGYPDHLRDALRFWLLSYNAAHSTIMTRVVAKKAQRDLVVTSAQPGVLYVSGLPVEKNVFSGLRRKLNAICKAFELTFGRGHTVEVRNKSCLNIDMPNESIDYVYTDPPFGANIPYSEVNFINEAWLGKITNQEEEVIVSPHQGKTVKDYHNLLVRAFQEINRVLRSDAKATVVFHSTSAQVWNAMRNACGEADLNITFTSVLDKTQDSFKQVTAPGVAKGDPIILLSKEKSKLNDTKLDLWDVVKDLVQQAAASTDPAELSPKRVFSRLVGYCLSNNHNVPINASEFYKQLQERALYENQPV